MKKLLIAGCSHSSGYGLEPNEPAWYDVIGEKYGYEITNTAIAGSSINYSLQCISNHIIKEDYDAIIFQLTDFSRFTIPFDGEGPFLSTKTADFKYNADSLLHVCKKEYLNALEGNSEELDIDPEVIKFIFEKVTLSRFNVNSMINQLHFIQKYLDSKKIKMVLVPYQQWEWGARSFGSIWRLDESSKIDKKYYIEETFMQWLEDNYIPDDYYFDNGYHLSAEGQLLFANKYLIPKLEKLNFK